MLFFIGNNADSYGPDRFNFVSAEFRINTYETSGYTRDPEAMCMEKMQLMQ